MRGIYKQHRPKSDSNDRVVLFGYFVLVNILFKIKRYENMPIQIYWKFYHQKMKIFR